MKKVIVAVAMLMLTACSASVSKDITNGDTRCVRINGGVTNDIIPIVAKVQSEGWVLSAVNHQRYWFTKKEKRCCDSSK